MKALIQEVTSARQSKDVNLMDTYERILNEGLFALDDIERKAIFLRFWAPSSIEQVSKELKISWDAADQIINRSIEKLRVHFSTHEMNPPPFKESRNT